MALGWFQVREGEAEFVLVESATPPRASAIAGLTDPIAKASTRSCFMDLGTSVARSGSNCWIFQQP